MIYIVVGISILVVVLASLLYAVVALKTGDKTRRITAFGEAPDEANPPS